jgi:hypothetical protein
MNPSRKTARIVGVLYIIGTAAGILSLVFAGSLYEPDYLTQVSANQTQIIIGVLLVLTMGFALAMVPVTLFPIFKNINETLAIGYIVFRGALEVATYIATVINMLLLLTLSQEFVQSGAPVGSAFETLGALFQEADVWINDVRILVFSLSALILNYILYKPKLIPRWLSGWGFVGAGLHFVEGVLGLFGLLTGMSTLGTIMALPIGLQEMVFAVWLIVKGFNPSAIAAESAAADR